MPDADPGRENFSGGAMSSGDLPGLSLCKQPPAEETTMSVFTRHRTGASDRSTTGTTRSPRATTVSSRMRHQQSRMPVIIAGTRLTV
jgi:hypothetical protein